MFALYGKGIANADPVACCCPRRQQHTAASFHDGHGRFQIAFDELEIPTPDINLEVGSGSHAEQTAEIMKRFEPIVLQHNPDAVSVVGAGNKGTVKAWVKFNAAVTIAGEGDYYKALALFKAAAKEVEKALK